MSLQGVLRYDVVADTSVREGGQGHTVTAARPPGGYSHPGEGGVIPYWGCVITSNVLAEFWNVRYRDTVGWRDTVGLSVWRHCGGSELSTDGIIKREEGTK